MAHHGWVVELDPQGLTPDSLKSPFGRLFAARDHEYDSLGISFLAGALGPMQESNLAGLPAPSPAKPANPAGFTFLGQFVDHDMTEFRVVGDDLKLIESNPVITKRQRVLEDVRRPEGTISVTTTNGRTGKLDLDSVYGLLGTAQPDLFDAGGNFRLHNDEDIMRGGAFKNSRLIADPRNDENKLITQIHILFEKLHNTIHATKSGAPSEIGPSGPIFLETKAEVVATYQRIILHDYIPRIVRAEQIDAVLEKLEHSETRYQAMNARNRALLRELGLNQLDTDATVAVPVEFSHAVFRLGHSQLRNGYLLRSGQPGVPLFDTSLGGNDLRGNKPLNPGGGGTNFLVQWRHFFKLVAANPQPGNAIDGNLPDAIFRLPPPAIGEPPVSLAERNIRRGVDFGLPSGQIAAAEFSTTYGFIEPTPLSTLFPDAIFAPKAEVLERAANLQWETPLWYYILKEAGAYTAGPQLGTVGGLVVAETLIGSIVEARLAQKRLEDPVGFNEEAETARIVGDIRTERSSLNPDGHDIGSGPLSFSANPSSHEDIVTMSQLIRHVGAN
jgi:hypothetical protein